MCGRATPTTGPRAKTNPFQAASQHEASCKEKHRLKELKTLKQADTGPRDDIKTTDTKSVVEAKKWKCPNCSYYPKGARKSTTINFLIKQHQQICTGGESFKCKQCGYISENLRKARKHEDACSDEYQFTSEGKVIWTCPKCHRAFSTSSHKNTNQQKYMHIKIGCKKAPKKRKRTEETTENEPPTKKPKRARLLLNVAKRTAMKKQKTEK